MTIFCSDEDYFSAMRSQLRGLDSVVDDQCRNKPMLAPQSGDGMVWYNCAVWKSSFNPAVEGWWFAKIMTYQSAFRGSTCMVHLTKHLYSRYKLLTSVMNMPSLNFR